MDSNDRANLVALMAKHAKTASRTRQSALTALVDEGIVDTDGNLTPEYGGETGKIRTKRKANKAELRHPLYSAIMVATETSD